MALVKIQYDFDHLPDSFYYFCETPEDWKAARAAGIPQGLLFSPRMISELGAAGLTAKEVHAVAHAKAFVDAKDIRTLTGDALERRPPAFTKEREIPRSLKDEEPKKIARRKK